MPDIMESKVQLTSHFGRPFINPWVFINIRRRCAASVYKRTVVYERPAIYKRLDPYLLNPHVLFALEIICFINAILLTLSSATCQVVNLKVITKNSLACSTAIFYFVMICIFSLILVIWC